jgi:contact-dependent growth inhibition (CDI) system CdiI-like immunity protein
MVKLRRRRHELTAQERVEIRIAFPNLGQVFSCYLGQDWPLEFASSMDALRAARDLQPKQQIDGAVVEIDELLSRNLDDASLSQIWEALGGGPYPETREMSGWLAEARRALSREDVQ